MVKYPYSGLPPEIKADAVLTCIAILPRVRSIQPAIVATAAADAISYDLLRLCMGGAGVVETVGDAEFVWAVGVHC